MPSCSSNSCHDADSVLIQNATALGERMVPDEIVDQVVALIRFREAFFPAECFVTRFELRHIFANCFNCPRIVDTYSRVFWFAQSGERAQEPQTANGEVQRIYRSRANFDQDLVVRRSRLFHVCQRENFGAPIFAMNDSFHGIVSSGFAITLVSRSPIGDKEPDAAY